MNFVHTTSFAGRNKDVLRTRYLLGCVIVLLFIQTPNEQLNTNAIDAYVANKMRWPRIPGLALAIVKDDRIVYLKAYGEADPSGRPVTPQTPFILGSVTKAFTALAVMQLVEAGKVSLDAPVQKYVPWFRTADATASAQITVRQLLYQTSGLPMLREPQLMTDQDAGALERTVRSFAHAQLDHPPGQTFAYSNANYDTAGLIVQTVSGMSYEDYVKQHIFAPLDMKNSFASQDEALKHGMAAGHRWWFGFPVAVKFPYLRSELPAGYLISSAEDMAHFVIAEMNGGRYNNSTVLSGEGMALTQTAPASQTYAMGWQRIEVDGRQLITHDGGTGHFETSVFFDPKERVGVFVGMNVMSALDAFSSPAGPDPLDGVSVRAIAQSVLNLATDRPLPDQGPGIRRLYAIFDLVILVLSTLLVVSLFRIGRRYKLWRRRIANRQSFGWRAVVKAITHFTLPLLILYLVLRVPLWGVAVMLQPDLAYWLVAVAVVLFVKGAIELTLMNRAFRQTYAR